MTVADLLDQLAAECPLHRPAALHGHAYYRHFTTPDGRIWCGIWRGWPPPRGSRPSEAQKAFELLRKGEA